MPRHVELMTSGFADAKAGYKAANRNGRYQRRRRGVPTMGADADYHAHDDATYIYMGEAARDADRNDVLLGQAVDRVVANQVQTGFTPNPDTGDSVLDDELLARFRETAADPEQCDPTGQRTFHDQERMIVRETLVTGECFALPQRDGTVQLVEFHRCRSPHRATKNNRRIIHGIEYADANRLRRRRYWFTSTPKSPWDQVDRKDLTPVPAYDDAGRPLVWQHYYPKRPSQSHGVTAFAPIFDVATMHDDTQFALALKQQLSSFFLLIRKRTAEFFANGPQTPRRGTKPNDTSVGTEAIEQIAPGMELKLADGEDVTPWSPNIPAHETMAHLRLMMQLIAVNLGCPLELLLLDGSMTNFSGWRGSIDQARMGFRANQQQTKRRFHQPWWRFKCDVWADADPALARAREQSQRTGAEVNLYRHDWDVPGWPYIEPAKDATADVIRLANGLTSPRRIAGERGLDRSEIAREIVSDLAQLIEHAATEADRLNAALNLEGTQAVTWRDLAPTPKAERVQVSYSGEFGHQEPQQNPTPQN